MASVYNRGTKHKPNWWIKYKDVSGVWRRKPTKQPTKETARRYAVEVAARVARNIIGIPDIDIQQRLTVAELFERFLSEYHGPKVRKLANYRTQKSSDYRSRVSGYALASMEAQKVRLVDIERWRDELRVSGYAPKTINESLQFARQVFEWAIRRELLDVRNPCTFVCKLPTQPLEEHYTLAQVHRLLAMEDLPIGVALAVYTGMRRGEIAALRWDDVDFGTGRIHIQRSYEGPTKTGRSRVIPLHRELKARLERWQPQCPSTVLGVVAPVFVSGQYRPANRRDERLASELRELLKKAGCPASFVRPWHAFRHTFATLFLEHGGSHAALERILGHMTSGSAVTALYIHVGLPFLARELDRMTLLPGRPPSPS